VGADSISNLIAKELGDGTMRDAMSGKLYRPGVRWPDYTAEDRRFAEHRHLAVAVHVDQRDQYCRQTLRRPYARRKPVV